VTPEGTNLGDPLPVIRPMKPILTSTLVRLGSAILAVTALSASVAGWLALNVIDTTLTLVPGISQTAEPSDDLLDAVDQALVEVRATLEVVGGITDRVADSTDDAAAIMNEIAVLSTGQIPDALTALQDSMPALIDTANVIDNTMQTLSFLGVDYDPDKPLDDALREVETQLDGLPETIAEQGDRIQDLVEEIRLTGSDTALIGARLEAIGGNLADAEATIDDYRQAVDDLGLVADVGTEIAAAVPAARVALVLLALSGVAMGIIGWTIAGRFQELDPVE
jgi:hypothetical protein